MRLFLSVALWICVKEMCIRVHSIQPCQAKDAHTDSMSVEIFNFNTNFNIYKIYICFSLKANSFDRNHSVFILLVRSPLFDCMHHMLLLSLSLSFSETCVFAVQTEIELKTKLFHTFYFLLHSNIQNQKCSCAACT